MILYPDTSLLVAALTGEDRSADADAWLAESLSSLAISGWLEVEVVSALAAKKRNEKISNEQEEAALDFLRGSFAGSSERLRILERTFVRAAEMIGLAGGLRGGDALHLAIAEAHEAVLVTLDRRQAALGERLGVLTRLL